MKHMRKAGMLLAVMLAFCCLSAPAWARVFFPKSIKEIGDEAFAGVPLQKNFLVKSGTEKIGSRAFADTGVELVWLPATLKYVAPDAFDEGTGFTCSPNTYAESWCLENGMDYDYIKPFLTATYTKMRTSGTAGPNMKSMMTASFGSATARRLMSVSFVCPSSRYWLLPVTAT